MIKIIMYSLSVIQLHAQQIQFLMVWFHLENRKICHLLEWFGTVTHSDPVDSEVQGAPIKNNPLRKINYLSYCNRYFHQIYSFTEEVLGHIGSKFCYNKYCGLKITTI